MTVKKLNQAQKDAVVTIFNHNAKTITEIAGFLKVSRDTVRRVLDESVYVSSAAQRVIDARDVMALLYKHKITIPQLKAMLEAPKIKNEDLPPLLKPQLQIIPTRKSPRAHNHAQHLLTV